MQIITFRLFFVLRHFCSMTVMTNRNSSLGFNLYHIDDNTQTIIIEAKAFYFILFFFFPHISLTQNTQKRKTPNPPNENPNLRKQTGISNLIFVKKHIRNPFIDRKLSPSLRTNQSPFFEVKLQKRVVQLP